MSDLLKSRFVQNAEFKSSVARLAASDLIHPIGTLRRTAQTARLLWRLNGQSSPSAGAVWMLVLVYSACVIFWLADRSDRSERTYGAIRRITRLAGWT